MEIEMRLQQWGDMSEGKVVAWRKKEKDSVKEHEILLDVDMSKAAVEVEAPATGTLSRILAAEGAIIHAGDIIAIITSA